MPSPTSLKRKQSLATGEPHTLLDFFGAKRPKPGPLLSLGKSSGADLDPIVISDDEELAESSTIVKPEPVLDLSFTEDEWEAGDDELLVIEDDADTRGACPEPSSSECLGNALLATSVSLGTCTICGLLLLDTTEAEINDHISRCLVRPGPESVTEIERQPSAGSHNKPALASTSKVSPLKPTASKIINALMSSREEKEAWDAADAVEAARRGAKPARPDVKGKSKAAGPSKPTKAGRQRRPAPFYKVMPGMPIAVDAFCYGQIPGVTAYFLSHAHSDHYTNLSSSWKHGPIYCSVTTANLIKFMLKVDPKWVRPLPNDESVEIPDTGGVRVTLVDANHCPGSSLFVFTGKQTIDAGDSPIKSAFVGSSRLFTYLHCGDFRACPAHALHPAIQGQRIDIVYLDTTYLSPKYCFPPQSMVIDACAQLAKQYVLGEKIKSLPVVPLKQTTMGGWFKPSPKLAARLESQSFSEPARVKNQKVLVVVGTYTIGKERVLKGQIFSPVPSLDPRLINIIAIANALTSKIYCGSRKHAVFMCQADPALHAMLTKDPTDAQVHVLPLGQISIEKLTEYWELHRKRHDRILGFRPTGWTYTPPAGQSANPTIEQVLAQARAHMYTSSDLHAQRGSNSRVTIYGVPYSEHSSFRELTCFALSVDWARMIATVNVGSAASRAKMSVWFEKWAKARKERGNIPVEYRSDEYW
ncbi:hypothetical protein FRC06_004202 [Ceratobasidium sp. 370]|nr:hypothetical protein FRC06_004202 [Ceratobasidium sp. 370]